MSHIVIVQVSRTPAARMVVHEAAPPASAKRQGTKSRDGGRGLWGFDRGDAGIGDEARIAWGLFRGLAGIGRGRLVAKAG